MEQEIKTEKKNKLAKWVMPIFLTLIVLGGFAIASVLIKSQSVSITMSEALSSVNTTIDLTAFPGETINRTIRVDNVGSADLIATALFTETANVNGSTYVATWVLNPITVPGFGSAPMTIRFAFDGATNISDITGTVTVTRTG